MTNKITLGQSGRFVLPKRLREELHLSDGDVFDARVQGNSLILRPSRKANRLRRERGVWVLRTGEPLKAAQAGGTVRSVRAQRYR